MPHKDPQKSKEYQRKYRAEHWEEKKAYQKEYRKTYKRKVTPEQSRRWNLSTKYGITIEQYNEMFTAQGGCCKICGKHQSKNGRSLAIDHDHLCCSSIGRSCGRCIRGLLCKECNRMLGYAGDNLRTLKNAISYLKKYKLDNQP